MVQTDPNSVPTSFIEDRIRWLEALAQEYDRLIPNLRTDSKRRRWQLRADACRFRLQQLRQKAAHPTQSDPHS